MSEDQKKKHIRTQGKYSDLGKKENQEKRQRVSPMTKLTEKRNNNRCSNGSNSTVADEDVVYPVKYEEHSDYSFHQLDESKPPVEIYEPGSCVISSTSNGESTIYFEPCFLEDKEAWNLFEDLYDSINWYSKNIVINGEEKQQPRMVAWFGPYSYSYSGATLESAEMPDCVLKIKWQVEEHLKEKEINATFNSVLLNLYRNNRDSVAWHSDDELTMGICPTIASVSLGETRKFELRPKKKYTENGSFSEKQAEYFVNLTNGSLVVMDGCMQDDWQHRIPKEYHDKDARINLTFRTVYPLEKSSRNRASERAYRRKDVETSNSNRVSRSNILDDEAFPPLSSNRSPPCSWKRSNIHEASSSSLESDILSRSGEIWESKSFVEKATGDLSSDNSYNSSFETSNVEHPENGECHSNDSVESPPRKSLNVLAKEFVPNFVPNYKIKISLEELIHYEVKLMHGARLMEFAYDLKSRVKERLSKFLQFDREEIEFLCLLTDGNQTEKNQKLITSRMIKIVSNSLGRSHFLKFGDKPHGYEKRSNNIDRGKKSYPKRGNAYKY